MKKNSLVLVATVLVLTMAAAAWAASPGWTISREEAREIRQVVLKIFPDAEVSFTAGKYGTVVTISQGPDLHDVSLTITLDGRVIKEKYYQHVLWIRPSALPVPDGEKVQEIMSKVASILNLPASKALGRGLLK